MNKMFSVFEVDIYNRTMLWHSIAFFWYNGMIHPSIDIPNCTAAYFYSKYIKTDNTSDWFIYILVYTPRNDCPILNNNVIRLWTHFGPISLLYKAVQTRNLGIPEGLDYSETSLYDTTTNTSGICSDYVVLGCWSIVLFLPSNQVLWSDVFRIV